VRTNGDDPVPDLELVQKPKAALRPKHVDMPKRLAISLKIHNSRYMEQESAILALGALAQDTRLDAFRLVVKSEREGVPAGELV